MSVSVKAVVFKTESIKYEEVMLERKKGSCLKSLQVLVGGPISILPHMAGSGAGWVAYANDEGMGMRFSAPTCAQPLAPRPALQLRGMGCVASPGLPRRGHLGPGRAPGQYCPL